jgi:hypothetical protein
MNKSTVSSKNMKLPNLMNGPAIFTTKNMIIGVLVVLLIFSFLGVNLLGAIGLVLQFIVNLIRPIFDGILGWVFYYIGAAVNVSADVVGDVARTGINIAEGTVHSVGNILQNEDNVGEPLPTQTAFYKRLFETTPIEEQDTIYTEEQDDVQSIAPDMGERVSSSFDAAEQIASTITGSITGSRGDLDKVIASELNSTVSSVSPSAAWCLVGQYGGKRSCISLDENEICESGQTYTKEDECLQLKMANIKNVISEKNAPKKEVVVVKKTEPTVYKQNWGIPPPRPPPASLSPPMGTNPYIPKTYGSYTHAPLYSTLPNPYYASNKYRNVAGTPNVTYVGPRSGIYLRK